MFETATSATATARLHVCLFFNTGRRSDLALAVAKVAVSDTASNLLLKDSLSLCSTDEETQYSLTRQSIYSKDCLTMVVKMRVFVDNKAYIPRIKNILGGT